MGGVKGARGVLRFSLFLQAYWKGMLAGGMLAGASALYGKKEKMYLHGDSGTVPSQMHHLAFQEYLQQPWSG